ncbi:MAG: ABC transporter ATP-binding protein, partial [Candidatus Ancillula sp.]|nr:ABC transporter ATP-binding protein [Candidatus Ancillula sp.]
MIRLLKKYLKPYLINVLFVVVFQALQTVCTLYLPNLNANIIDNGVVTGDINYIWHEGAIMISLAILQFVLSISATYFGAKTAFSLGRDLRRDLFSRVQDFSVREFSQFGAPTLITRTTNDVLQVQNVTMFLLTLIITAPIMFIGGIILSLEQDVALSGVIACTFPIVVIVALIFVSKLTPIFRKFQKRIDRLNEVLREQITGVRVVKAFTRENSERERFHKANNNLFKLDLRTGRYMTTLFPIFMFIINLSL